MSARAREKPATPEELAAMEFSPASPPFRLPTGKRLGWLEIAGNEFPFWVLIECILKLDDKGLADKCKQDPDANSAFLLDLAKIAARWEAMAKVARSAEIRLACALHRVAAS